MTFSERVFSGRWYATSNFHTVFRENGMLPRTFRLYYEKMLRYLELSYYLLEKIVRHLELSYYMLEKMIRYLEPHTISSRK